MGYRTVVHVPGDVHAWYRRLAAARKMTMAGFIEMCVRREVGQMRKKQQAADDGADDVASRPPFWAKAGG